MRTPVPDDLILGLLASRPQHGYELLAHFAAPAELGRVWTMSTSQIYAVLKRLDGLGLIRGRSRRGQDAPDRIEYSLTTSGQRRLNHWLLEEGVSASVRSIRVVFISKLHIAELLGRPTEPIIDRQRAACRARLRVLDSARRSATTPTEQRSLEFVIGQLSAAIAWLDGIAVVSPADRGGL